MVSRDQRVIIDSTDLIKAFIVDMLSYRPPHKRQSTRLKVPVKPKVREHKSKFFTEIPFAHFYRMSGTFFNFKVDIVGHLETFKDDWYNKVVPVYPVLKKFMPFNFNIGNHATAVNHPANKGKKNSLDPQLTRHFYKLLLQSEPNVVRAICHMVLMDFVCFPEYRLPAECEHLNASVVNARALLLAK